MPANTFLKFRPKYNQPALTLGLAFLVTLGLLLVSSRASSTPGLIEAEESVLTGAAAVGTDAGAAGGEYVALNSPAYDTPCSGTDVFPANDFKAIADAAPAGTTFCIKPGTHRLTGQIIAGRGDRFIGEPGAILNGSKILTSFTQSGDYWYADGQTQQSGGPSVNCDDDPFTGQPYTFCGYGEKVFANGTDLWQVESLADLPAGATDRFFIDYAADRIYLAFDPAGDTIEATAGIGGIKGFGGSNQDFVLVEGLIFEKFGVDSSGEGPIKTGEDWTVRHNEVRYSSGTGIRMGDRSKAIDNHIHHMGRYGMFGFAPDILVQGNELSYNKTDGHTNWDAGATKFIKSSRTRFINNHVHHNYGNGLWADADNADTLYEGNYVHDNQGIGIFHEISCSGTIRNNVLVNNDYDLTQSLFYGADILLNGTKDTEIYGNDITSGAHSISLVSTERGTSPNERGEPDCANFHYEIKNINIHDNTIRMSTGHLTGAVGAHPQIWTTNNNTFSNNDYYLQDINADFWNWSGSLHNRTEWLATGQDAGSTFTSGLGTSPSPDMSAPQDDVATDTLNLLTSRTYRVWSRVKVPDATNDSYELSIDGGAPVVIGGAGITPGTWTWVDWQAGVTSNSLQTSLAAGSHTVTMTGLEDGIQIDRLVFASDLDCVPTGNGDNCLPPATTLRSDLNTDGTVSVFDLSILLSAWGSSDESADINNDSTVNAFDLSMLLSDWGQTQ